MTKLFGQKNYLETAPRPIPALVWPGKTRRCCRTVRPLLLREYHGQTNAAAGPLLPNLLVRADNRLLLSSLLHGPLRRAIDARGGIRLAYMDPPFAVGTDFTMPVAREGRISAVAYSDIWPGGLAGFLNMMHERLLLLRDLLAPDGSLFLHCDHRTAPHLRLLLDEVFGPERFLGDIVWHYTGGGRARRWFSRKHDRILHYARSASWTFNPDAVRVPYKPTSAYAKSGITSRAGKRYLPDPRGTPVDDVWDIPMINPLSFERSGYPTQKPESLLERIILAASEPGDLVADFFCGSGTTAAVAERLGRRWIVCDQAPLAVQATAKRLESMPGSAPFILASLEDKLSHYQKKTKSASPTPPPVFTHRARLKHKDIAYDLSDVRISLRRGENGIFLELESFSVTLQEGLSALPEHLALSNSNGLAWLDGWSIGLAPGPDFAYPGCRADFLYNRVLWQARRGRDNAINLTSPELVPPVKDAYSKNALVVTVNDIFGNESRLAVPL
ncbi:MAG: site-specific DNA-methyltransferase [Desulfovibrionaceae bacterium]|nr:site-specific DNA-methyltransferase [Desulfovibrionaceae bacterium]